MVYAEKRMLRRRTFDILIESQNYLQRRALKFLRTVFRIAGDELRSLDYDRVFARLLLTGDQAGHEQKGRRHVADAFTD